MADLLIYVPHSASRFSFDNFNWVGIGVVISQSHRGKDHGMFKL